MRYFICLFVILILSALPGYAQCVPSKFCVESAATLKRAKFNPLKSFPIELDDPGERSDTYSYVLTKGRQYMVAICSSEKKPKIELTILDKDRMPVASNRMKKSYQSTIVFDCKTTGIYYFKYTAQEQSMCCGGSALGFSK